MGLVFVVLHIIPLPANLFFPYVGHAFENPRLFSIGPVAAVCHSSFLPDISISKKAGSLPDVSGLNEMDVWLMAQHVGPLATNRNKQCGSY